MKALSKSFSNTVSANQVEGGPFITVRFFLLLQASHSGVCRNFQPNHRSIGCMASIGNGNLSFSDLFAHDHAQTADCCHFAADSVVVYP
jgi:hypothetical protein